MKSIIFLNRCLRSKIIYFKYVNDNYKNIKGIVELPINISKKRKFFLLRKGIFNNNAISYIFYQFLQIVVYQIISFIFSSDISDLCKKKNIKYIKMNRFPSRRELKKKINTYLPSDIIFCSTTYILKKKNLILKNPILNFHESNPKLFKGSAIYFRFFLNKIKHFTTCIMELHDGIDNGRIIIKSKKISLKKKTIFLTAVIGYFYQMINLNNLKKIKITKKYPNFKVLKKTEIYSFPSIFEEIQILKKGGKLFNISDIVLIFQLITIKCTKNLYEKIKLNYTNLK